MKKGIKWLLVVCAVIVGSGLAACGGASEEAKEPLNTHAAKQESIDESAVSENENDMGDNSEAVSVSSSVGD